MKERIEKMQRIASWQDCAKITSAQKQELRELIKKLGWSEAWYENEMGRIDEMLYFRAVACVSGLLFLYENPKQWTIKS